MPQQRCAAITAKKGCEAASDTLHITIGQILQLRRSDLGKCNAQPTKQRIQATPRYTCKRKRESGLLATASLATEKKAET